MERKITNCLLNQGNRKFRNASFRESFFEGKAAFSSGSFCALLFWNEGRIDMSKIAKNAVSIDSQKISSINDGKLISLTGVIDSNEIIKDDLFIKPAKYLVIERISEMYSWKEDTGTTHKTNLGGTETSTTDYSYEKIWTDKPE